MEERSGRTALAVLVAVFAVLAVVVAFVWLRPGSSTPPDVDAGRTASDLFLNQIRGGQAEQAWQSTTAEFKSAEGRESFVKYVKQHPFLGQPLSFVSVQIVTAQNEPRAEYLYRDEKDGATVRLLTSFENTAWRVDRITVD